MQNPIIQQVVETLRGANNVLITVKNSPSVDELTASIALTLILNHMNKHATTVFSGQVPSTIEFLQPEMAIETTTDSLRDFIIALDKSKADKLRYKVENDVVRIFITPYRSSISEEDLEFSQGDFNVDVVVALGVLNKEDFDQAVLEHGRILHDATVIAINNQPVPNEVGAVSWQDQQASSVSEMIAGIADLFGQNIIDGQIATALMTGIVAETDRFKNQKTTPQVLSISSTLMSAGANQQLIAEELERPPVVNSAVQPLQFGAATNSDGTLSVSHDEPAPIQDINIDEHGNIKTFAQPAQDPSPLLSIEHDLGLEAAKHTENEDIAETHNDQAESNDQQLPEQQEDGDSGHSLIEDRSFLMPPMNANTENDAAQEEPSGLFGSFMHKVKSSAHKSEDSGEDQEAVTKKPKRIEPLESFRENMDFQDDMPLFKAEEEPTSSTPEELGSAEAADKELSPFVAADEQQVEPPAPPVLPPTPYMPPVMPDQSTTPPAVNSSPVTESTSVFDENKSDQTLEDIEHAVHSPHVEVPGDSGAVGSAFIGGTQPTDLTQFAAELPPVVSDAVPPINPSGMPASTPPTNETAAPIVPPPLMPQVGGSQMPQFFEADGSKSNPFVSPS